MSRYSNLNYTKNISDSHAQQSSMHLSSALIQKALEFAYRVHQVDQRQSRKGKQVPYLFHVLAVANILERTGANETVVAAGILHDTIEDSNPKKPVTREILQKEFGTDVARIVNDLSEQNTELPWMERKLHALEHVAEMDEDSLLVKSADVLHNLSDQIDDYIIKGERIFANFNAPKDAQLIRYRSLIEAIKKRWTDNPLVPALEERLKTAQTLWEGKTK